MTYALLTKKKKKKHITWSRYEMLCSMFSSVQKALTTPCTFFDKGIEEHSTCWEYKLDGDIFVSEVY